MTPLEQMRAELAYWKQVLREASAAGDVDRVLLARAEIGKRSHAIRRLEMQEAHHAGD